jgi:flagellar protein FlaG
MQPISLSSSIVSRLSSAGTQNQATSDIPRKSVSEKTPRTPDAKIIDEAISAANTALKSISSSLEFSKDSSTGKDLVRIIDTNSNEVIRQFPTEEMLAIARAIDNFKGLLIDQKA